MSKRPAIVFLMIVVSLTAFNGCASTLSTKKSTVYINSEPQGASIHLFDANTYKETLLGITPGNFEIPLGKRWIFLKAKLDGYETKSTLITSSKTNYSFTLDKEWMGQILDERLSGKYTKEFTKRSVSVVGTFDKAVNSPRMLFASVYKEGENELRQLKLDFPEMRTTALMNALEDCRLKMDILTMAGILEHTPWESMKIGEVQSLISKIHIGLGSY